MSKKRFQYVCDSDQVSQGHSRIFSITNELGSKIEIALFNVDDKFFAISNTCAHQGGPLGKGVTEGEIVTCPWHGWKYSVKTGKSPHKGGDSVNTYPVRISDGRVYVSSIPNNIGIWRSEV